MNGGHSAMKQRTKYSKRILAVLLAVMMLLAAALAGGEWPLAGRAIAGFIFLIFTTPVAAHLLARAAVISGQSPGREGMRRKKARGAEKAQI